MAALSWFTNLVALVRVDSDVRSGGGQRCGPSPCIIFVDHQLPSDFAERKDTALNKRKCLGATYRKPLTKLAQ